jgi:cytidine deaminase
MKPDADQLMAEAQRARRRAFAPYSGFAVGAALLADDGRVFVVEGLEVMPYRLCWKRSTEVSEFL